jgi:CrcB protein
MKAAFYVFLGGGLGSVTRYLIGKASTKFIPANFPAGTLIANILASLFLGYIMSKLIVSDSILRPLIAIGFCGGFSTFSTFSYDTAKLFSEGRMGEAFINIGVNTFLCLIAIYAGTQLGK